MPDGMKCDERGNIWVTAPGGVWVYAPAASFSARSALPELAATSPGAAPDFRTLFVTATHSVYTVPTKVGPRPEPYMRPRARRRERGARWPRPRRSRPPPPR